eukprot:CAMPEP_0206188748 /NCGR_PEP_ID=MMETSP0166-20121206/3755_1 /ASSEMBLY_ACC=CAM_ASM_000260 /TAXON_ID=95228 /ORGANISM="Vannella robusta, Strain DIVA3 518/3/11/1/6" /LENGTH=33 /DNA_ID= /DNA_START= /DNA_END= /DNA_ORIENTATION=
MIQQLACGKPQTSHSCEGNDSTKDYSIRGNPFE